MIPLDWELSTVSSCLPPPHIFLPISKIKLSAKDSENERIDRQSMQHQLHKVLKELRKARDQITKLESSVSLTEHHKLHVLYSFLSL